MSASEAPAVAAPATVEPKEPAATTPWWSAVLGSRLWRDAIAPTIVLRVVLLVFGFFAVVVVRPDALTGNYTDLWNRWDAPHFIEISRYGYGPPAEDARIVLLPVFPFLLRALSPYGDPAAVGMFVAFVATLAAAA